MSLQVSAWMSDLGVIGSRNARLFVIFRTLYHARAYYPVFAVMFTDMGLSLEQFMLLNVVWAGAILLCEVPSGALADCIGRKRLLVFAAAMMVAEMAVLLVAPSDGGVWLFALCLVNRLLSGVSEAAASGSDEAIAYEALPEDGREDAWDRVLGSAMRIRSVGFLIAMTLGGLLYDLSWWNQMVPEAFHVGVEISHRLPVAVVFLQACGCLVIALRFHEVTEHHTVGVVERLREATRLTLETAWMAVTTRVVAVVLLGGLMIDAVARNMATLNSAYYRLVGLPEWMFGLIGSSIAVCNWFVPAIAARVNRRMSPTGSLVMGGGFALFGLCLLVPARVGLGIPGVVVMMMLLGYVNFTVSRYLHQVAASRQRATLLSVKGMAFNLGYGGYALAFSGLLTVLERPGGVALKDALVWQAGGFAVVLVLYALVVKGGELVRRSAS